MRNIKNQIEEKVSQSVKDSKMTNSLFSKKIQPLPQNKLKTVSDNLTKTLLTAKSFSKQELKKFVYAYTQYIITREKLDGCTLMFDKNLKTNDTTKSYVRIRDSKIFLNEKYFQNTNQMGQVFEIVSALEHECQHIVDCQNLHQKPDSNFNKECDFLISFLGRQYGKVLKDVGYFNYLFNEQEVSARHKEIVQYGNLLRKFESLLQQDKTLPKTNAKILLQVFKNRQKLEAQYSNTYQKILNKETHAMKEVNLLLTEKLNSLSKEDLQKLKQTHTTKVIERALNMNGLKNEDNIKILAGQKQPRTSNLTFEI